MDNFVKKGISIKNMKEENLWDYSECDGSATYWKTLRREKRGARN
jgi:hypothetical protein